MAPGRSGRQQQASGRGPALPAGQRGAVLPGLGSAARSRAALLPLSPPPPRAPPAPPPGPSSSSPASPRPRPRPREPDVRAAGAARSLRPGSELTPAAPRDPRPLRPPSPRPAPRPSLRPDRAPSPARCDAPGRAAPRSWRCWPRTSRRVRRWRRRKVGATAPPSRPSSGGRAASGAAGRGARAPLPFRPPGPRGVDAPASASPHVRPRCAGLGGGAGGTRGPCPDPGTRAALRARPRTRAPRRSQLPDPSPGAALTQRLESSFRALATCASGPGGPRSSGPTAPPRPAAPPAVRIPRAASSHFPGLPRFVPSCSPWAACPRFAVEGTGRWERPRQEGQFWGERSRGGTHPGRPGPHSFKIWLTASVPPQNLEISLSGMCLLAF